MLVGDSVALALSGIDLLKLRAEGEQNRLCGGDERAGIEGAALKAPGCCFGPRPGSPFGQV